MKLKSRARAIVLVLAVALLTGGSTVALVFYRQFLERGVAYHDQGAVTINHASGPTLGANTFLTLEPDIENIRRELAVLKSAGVGIIRQQFLWEEIEPEKGVFRNRQTGVSTWTKYDAIVEAAREHGIEVMARLERSPRWATPGWEPKIPASQKPPDDVELFADFVHAVVSRYEGRIRFFQIWNEPNLWGEWGESEPDAAEYVELLKASYQAAKAANPHAVVVAAGLAPTTERGPNNISDVLYLQRLYFLGAKEYFDILSSMSYGLITGPSDVRIGERWTNFPRAVLLRDVMETFGDAHKPVWASEYGWMSLPDGWSGRPSIWGNHPVEDQAAWTVQGILRARTEWPWMPTIFLWASRWPEQADPDDPTFWFRLMDPDFTPRPALLALQELALERPIAGAGLHQEDHPAFTYAGPWPREPSDEAAAGFWSSTGVPGALAKFRFEGENVSLVARQGPDMGMLRVRIDGLDALADLVPRSEFGESIVDLYSPEVRPASTIPLASRLPAGVHVLEVESLGRASPRSTGGKVVIDGIVVLNSRPFWPYAATGIAWAVALGLIAWRFARPIWDAVPARIRQVRLTPPLLRSHTVYGVSSPALLTASAAAILLAALPGGDALSPLTILRLVILAYLAALAIARPDAVAVVTAGAQFLHPLRPQTGPVAFSVPELLLMALATGWAARGFYRRKFELRRSTIGFVAAYFVLAALASTAFAEYPKFALRSFRTTVVEPVALFFLLTAFLSGRRGGALIPAVAAGGAIAAATIVFDPLLDRVITAGVPRLRGIYESPNNLAFVLERTIPLLVGLAVAWKGSALGRAATAVAAGASVVLILTFSRGAWLAAVAATALLGLPQLRRLPVKRRVLGLGAVLIPVAALAALVGADRLSILFRTGDRSGVSRVWLWDSAIEMIRDFPLFGVGPDNFLYHYAAYLRPEAWREPHMSHPHNLLLDNWLSSGVFGALAIIAVLVIFYLLIRRSYCLPDCPIPRPVLLGVAASMTAAIAHGLVDNFYFLPELAGFFWTLMAFAVCLTNRPTRQPDSALETQVGPIEEGQTTAGP